MESIMWSQGTNSTDEAFILIDGILTRYSKTVEQNHALSILFSSKFRTIADNKKCPNTSPSFKLKRMRGWTCVEGNFLERDEADRLRVYIFACKSHSTDKVISSLQNNSKLLGCTLMQEDINIIKKNNKIQLIKIALCLMIVAIVGICLL